MLKESIEKLCNKLGLGNLKKQPVQVFGGLLHKMYKVETEVGEYAVKLLNSNIMKRKTAKKKYIFSEKVSHIASESGIPAIPAIGDEEFIHYIDGSCYMVFKWVKAKGILPEKVNQENCIKIGKILAQLHNIDFSNIYEGVDIPSEVETDWEKYCEVDSEISNELLKVTDKLYKWERIANKSAIRVYKNQIISHRDMDCKNVLWDKDNNPIVIDWEASGYVNPLQELIDVAMAWAGIETDDFNLENFKTVIESYVQNAGEISDEISSVLNFGYKGKLEWLEYNIKRSIGIESSKKEQKLGAKEVIKTLKALKNYERFLPKCEVVLKSIKSSVHRKTK